MLLAWPVPSTLYSTVFVEDDVEAGTLVAGVAAGVAVGEPVVRLFPAAQPDKARMMAAAPLMVKGQLRRCFLDTGSLS